MTTTPTQAQIDTLVNQAMAISEKTGPSKKTNAMLLKAWQMEEELLTAQGTHPNQHYDYGR